MDNNVLEAEAPELQWRSESGLVCDLWMRQNDFVRCSAGQQHLPRRSGEPMIYQEILETPSYQRLSLAEKGLLMDIYMHNMTSGGLPLYVPPDDESGRIIQALEQTGLITAQMCLETLKIGYINVYAEQYLMALEKASVVPGDQGIKSTGLIERSRNKQCAVGYKELGNKYEGYLPTSRYDTSGQVYFVSDSFLSEIDRVTIGVDTRRLLEDYFHFLLTNPKLRPNATRMGASIIKYSKNRYGTIGESREKMLLEALSVE